MPEEPHEDRFDEALRSPERYIDNDDFSRRVMRALPKARPCARIPIRKWIIGASALTGFAFSIPLFPTLGGLPLIRVAVDSPWFLTIAIMAVLGCIAFAAWWLIEDRV